MKMVAKNKEAGKTKRANEIINAMVPRGAGGRERLLLRIEHNAHLVQSISPVQDNAKLETRWVMAFGLRRF